MTSLSYVSDEYLLSQAGIDTEKFKLKRLCKRGHNWNNTGKSLRYNTQSSNCVECSHLHKLSKAKHNRHPNPDSETALRLAQKYNVDVETFAIGAMCKYEHNWNNTGYGLRYIKNSDKPGACVTCCLGEEEKIHIEKDNPETQKILRSYNIPIDRYYLGRICIHGHDWKDTGYSLRFYKNSACCGCVNLQKPGYTKEQIIEDRNRMFWDTVNVIDDEDSCWDWKGQTNEAGYGQVTYLGKNWRSHRLAYTLSKGKIPKDMVVMHKCDRPICNRPSHLSLGTPYDNVQDMIQKGRKAVAPKGEDHPLSKLTEDDIRQIRKLYNSKKYTNVEIANMFGTTKTNIRSIGLYETWKHVN